MTDIAVSRIRRPAAIPPAAGSGAKRSRGSRGLLASHQPTETRPDTAASPFGNARRGLAAMLRLWLARSRQRRALRALDDDRLRDIGLTRAMVRDECCRPFWR